MVIVSLPFETRVKCEHCDCVFEAGIEDLEYYDKRYSYFDNPYGETDAATVKCPLCKKRDKS